MEETIVPLQRVKKVIGLEVISSTQDLALELAQKGEPSATLVLACEQTAARRQDGTRFAAAEGGVYFTLILRPSQNEGAASSLARQAALAAADTLGEMFAVRTKVKPDHSVLAWDGKNRQWKKIAGVLVESFAAENQPFVLVGVGVNVNNRLPAREKESTSLKQLIGTETSKELFLDGLLDRFWTHYAHGFLAVR